MDAGSWKRVIGESAWKRVLSAACAANQDWERRALKAVHPAMGPDTHPCEDVAAAALTAAVECGFRAPEVAPTVTTDGARVLWPRADGGSIATITARGLLRTLEARGHGFYLLRAGQLLRAAAGTLLPHFQDLLIAYEAECARDGIPALPSWADVRVFVGGEAHAPVPGRDAWVDLFAESPMPGVVHRASARGPGAE